MDTQPPIRVRINAAVLELTLGDITQQTTDAIVNAANSSLLGGGGVDGAIHRAAGPRLLAKTRTLGGCQTGDAKITPGYNLPARYIIHAVGPIYRDADEDVARLLASAYRRCLELAVQHRLETIAFPSISTGAYGYPVEEAAPIALRTVCDFLQQNTCIRLVRFVLFSLPILEAYHIALAQIAEQRRDIQMI
ncbi:MAG: O-acetyl-ADP-ribose deacetylase [Chloroflexi bacterium]|nr:O-acetyl-ADP-ribose deacetylase [Chloroflexota bacterium]